ncbi:MAG TPA: helix-turn-helix transcriptional regulator [Thermoanaerobaculia bacterium]|nr:helix-turn-helix transcriptional regulator [Thermoanaerobaculia bacterium]
MITTLRTLMRILGFRNADVERKLGWSVSYLSRLYSGGIELRFEHIVDIAGALGLRPEEVFRFAYPDLGEGPSEAATQVRTATASLGGIRLPATPPAPAPEAPPPPAITEADVERIVAKTLRRFLSDGTPPDEK